MNIVDFSTFLHISHSPTPSSRPKRSSSTSTIKKFVSPYEIVNSKRLTLLHQKQLNTFTFYRISKKIKQLVGMCLEKAYNHKSCHTILHNWQTNSLVEFVKGIGYQLIEKGMIINYRVKDSNKTNHKNITYISQLKESLAQLYRPQRIWIIFSNSVLTLSPCNHHSQVHKNLLVDYENRTLVLATSIDEPSPENQMKTLIILEESLRIREKIQGMIKDQKQLFSSEQERFVGKNVQTITLQNKIPSIEYCQTRKMSQQTVQQQPKQKKQKVKRKKRKLPSSSSGSSSSSSSVESKYKKRRNQEVIAENIHLKWVITAMEDKFKKQSVDYIQKMQEKVEMLRQERKIYIDQSISLKRENEELAKLVDSKNIINEQLTFKNKGLESDNKNVLQVMDENRMIKAQLAKLKKEESQNKQEINTLKSEIDEYQSICGEMKEVYDNLRKQFALQKNRNQNLEKRCANYEEKMKQILRIDQPLSQYQSQRSIRNKNKK